MGIVSRLSAPLEGDIRRIDKKKEWNGDRENPKA